MALQLLVLMHVETQNERKELGFVRGRPYSCRVVDLCFSLQLDSAAIKPFVSECSC